MTGVSWGNYQDYLYGRFDGMNHEDEAQTDRDGEKISHGGDVYYMCPGDELRQVSLRRRAARARCGRRGDPPGGTGILGERGGYSEGFKREWQQLITTKTGSRRTVRWMPNGAPPS